MVDDYPSEWNIDDEILKLLKDMMVAFFQELRAWKLDAAYWNLSLMGTLAEAKFTDNEKKDLMKDMNKLEKTRKEYLNDKSNRGKFFYELRETFRKINRYAQKNNMWLRKKEDIGL